MGNSAKWICHTGIGIALYVALSMVMKIPLVGHIVLDLGYIVLTVYCYISDGQTAALVGGCGCMLVSLINSGWFPPGWILGNLAISYICARCFKTGKVIWNMIVSVAACFIGIAVIKTAVECFAYGIPFAVKFPKNGVAFFADSATMCIGCFVSRHIPEKYLKQAIK